LTVLAVPLIGTTWPARPAWPSSSTTAHSFLCHASPGTQITQNDPARDRREHVKHFMERIAHLPRAKSLRTAQGCETRIRRLLERRSPNRATMHIAARKRENTAQLVVETHPRQGVLAEWARNPMDCQALTRTQSQFLEPLPCHSGTRR